MDIFIKKRDIYVFIFLLLYKLLLDFTYVQFIFKLYNYARFILDFNLNKYLISLVWFLGIFYIMPKDNKKPSSVFLQLHFIVMIIPMFTIYALTNESDLFMTLCCIFYIMECVILRMAINIKIVKIKNSKKILPWIIMLISGFVYVSMIKANGLPSLKALDLNKVYEVRSQVRYPLLMSYMVPWQIKIINPFLITSFYIKGNKKALYLSIIFQIMMYLIIAHKAALFIPLAIIIVLYILKKRDFLFLGSLFAPLGIMCAFFAYKLFGNITIPSLAIRRLLFLPAQLKFFYYDFFSEHNFLYFSEGLIGKIFGLASPYNIRTTYMIGGLYYSNFETSANTGYLADAYANMGIFGMLIISLLFSFILILIDSLSKNINKEMVVGLCLFSILSLNDVALLTTLLTGGLFLLFILLYLYPSDYEERVDYFK